MAFRPLFVGGLLLSLLPVACATNDSQVENLEGAATTGSDALRAVDIVVSARRTGDIYQARSYPHDDMDYDGQIELYDTPVYYVYVKGTNAKGESEEREWKAPRFMPYYNDPEAPVAEYKTRGFVTAGLGTVPRKPVGQYKPDYEVHNRFSPFGGAIVVKGSFYIHAGPPDLADSGWGSAGCVEIIGSFDDFKSDILTLAGSNETDLNKGISQLVAAQKLFVTYEPAQAPDLKAALSRPGGAGSDTENDSSSDRTDPSE